MKPQMKWLVFAAVAVAAVACTQSDDVVGPPPGSTDAVSAVGARGAASPPAAAVASPPSPMPPPPSPTPSPQFSGFEFEIGEGDFWDYRWSTLDRSCAQGRGCSSDKDDGLFRITLGEAIRIQDEPAYKLEITGDPGSNAPPWRYLAVSDNKILGSSDGSSLVVLFDAQTGVWAGSGFFKTRFESDELAKASPGNIFEQETTASWSGFRTGPAFVVGRADSQSECETIAGYRICPRQESYSFTENEWFRPGIGAVAYRYQSSSSYSGGGFFSSYSSEENVGLVASSFRGDSAAELNPGLPDMTEFVEQFLENAVKAEIVTFTESDDSHLSEFMTGEPMRRARETLRSLADQGIYHVPQFDFTRDSTIEIRTLSEIKIEVDRCEVWSGEYFSQSDGTQVRKDGPELTPQTITIERLSAGWFISAIAFYDPPSFC